MLIGGTAQGDVSSVSFAEKVDQALAFWHDDDLDAALALLSPLADDGETDKLSGEKGFNVIIEGDEGQWSSTAQWNGSPPPVDHNNLGSRYDINRDGYTTPLDVLLLVNYLNGNTVPSKGETARALYDVSNDGHISPIDVLHIIDRLNANSYESKAEGEYHGEAAVQESWTQAAWVLYVDFLDELNRPSLQFFPICVR